MDNREKQIVEKYLGNMSPEEKSRFDGALRGGSLDGAISAMKPEEAKKARELLNDRAALEKLLKSTEAQKIIKMFSDPGGRRNGQR